MEKSTGPTYTRYHCCSGNSCGKFESWWDAGECYTNDGKIVKSCDYCKSEVSRD
ncbi:MAG: hypothetical protein WBG50_00610 [Desulfomonilaceae bacterium]